jgi:hypothetical protein
MQDTLHVLHTSAKERENVEEVAATRKAERRYYNMAARTNLASYFSLQYRWSVVVVY